MRPPLAGEFRPAGGSGDGGVRKGRLLEEAILTRPRAVGLLPRVGLLLLPWLMLQVAVLLALTPPVLLRWGPALVLAALRGTTEFLFGEPELRLQSSHSSTSASWLWSAIGSERSIAAHVPGGSTGASAIAAAWPQYSFARQCWSRTGPFGSPATMP